jgi:hypothetical protein
MEREDDIRDELNEIAPGFPEKKSLDAPEGYFESFSDQVLNRWRKEESQPVQKRLKWKSVLGIAAVLTALCVGGWWFFQNPTTDQMDEITSAEAFQYIHENIGEFEYLIETSDIPLNEGEIEVPQEGVEEYLIEEMHGNDPEILF